MSQRDQSEDRQQPKFVVAYIENESSPRWSAMPWKVFDLRTNPGMSGTQGRFSFFTARHATDFAASNERLAKHTHH